MAATPGYSIPLYLQSATHLGGAIAKVHSAVITPSSITHEDPGDPAEAGGPAVVDSPRDRIDIELFGRDPSALRALVGAAATNLVMTTKGDAGLAETETIKSVKFHSFGGPYQVRSREDGGVVQAWSIRGTAQWGPTDTLALMWVTAAVA
jgi:hypothetical protein